MKIPRQVTLTFYSDLAPITAANVISARYAPTDPRNAPRLISFVYDTGIDLYSKTGRLGVYENSATARIAIGGKSAALPFQILRNTLCEARSVGFEENTVESWVVSNVTYSDSVCTVEFKGPESLLRGRVNGPDVIAQLLGFNATGPSLGAQTLVYGGTFWHAVTLAGDTPSVSDAPFVLSNAYTHRVALDLVSRFFPRAINSTGPLTAGWPTYGARANIGPGAGALQLAYAAKTSRDAVSAPVEQDARNALRFAVSFAQLLSAQYLFDFSEGVAVGALTGFEEISYASSTDTCLDFLARVGATYDAGLCMSRGRMRWRSPCAFADVKPSQNVYDFNDLQNVSNLTSSLITWDGWRAQIEYNHNYADGFIPPPGFPFDKFTLAPALPIASPPQNAADGNYPSLFQNLSDVQTADAQMAGARQATSSVDSRSVSFRRDARGHDMRPGDLVRFNPQLSKLFVLRVSGDLCANAVDVTCVELSYA